MSMLIHSVNKKPYRFVILTCGDEDSAKFRVCQLTCNLLGLPFPMYRHLRPLPSLRSRPVLDFIKISIANAHTISQPHSQVPPPIL